VEAVFHPLKMPQHRGREPGRSRLCCLHSDKPIKHLRTSGNQSNAAGGTKRAAWAWASAISRWIPQQYSSHFRAGD
jgi:hypothetical protein